MRTRNIKMNVFLNEDEKKLLMDKSKKAKLSQSEFIRELVRDYYHSKLTKTELDNIVNSLSKMIDELSLLKKHLEFSSYSVYTNFISKQINTIQNIVYNMRK